MYSHTALAIDLVHTIRHHGELCLRDETRGKMIEISPLLQSATNVVHLHHNDWPLPATFCGNVNKPFCLFSFRKVCGNQLTLFLFLFFFFTVAVPLKSYGFPCKVLKVAAALHHFFFSLSTSTP